MSSRTLFRLSAIALVSGSILLAIGSATTYLLLPQGLIGMSTAAPEAPGYFLRIIGATLLLLGMPGLFVYHAQSKRGVILGFVGLVMMFVGFSMIEVGQSSASVYAFVPMASHAATKGAVLAFGGLVPLGTQIAQPTTLLMETIGPLLFGIAILRAKSFSRLAGVLFLLIGVGRFFSLTNDPDTVDIVIEMIGGVLFAVMLIPGVAACATTLWSAVQGSPSEQPRPVEAEKLEEAVRV